MAYTHIVNAAGYCAASRRTTPASTRGLPVGLQIMGPPNGEARVLRAARALRTGQALELPAARRWNDPEATTGVDTTLAVGLRDGIVDPVPVELSDRLPARSAPN